MSPLIYYYAECRYVECRYAECRSAYIKAPKGEKLLENSFNIELKHWEMLRSCRNSGHAEE